MKTNIIRSVAVAALMSSCVTAHAATWEFAPIASNHGTITTFDCVSPAPANCIGFDKDFTGLGSLEIGVTVTKEVGDAGSSTFSIQEAVNNHTNTPWGGYSYLLTEKGEAADQIAFFAGGLGEADPSSTLFSTVAITPATFDLSDGHIVNDGWFTAEFDISVTWEELTEVEFLLVQAPSPVPIPAAIWFFGSAMIGLVGFSRKKAQVAVA